MAYPQKESKAVGSIYINAPKDASPELWSKIDKMFEFIQQNKISLSVSFQGPKVAAIAPNAKGYISTTACANQYRDKQTKPHFVIMPPREDAGAPVAGKVTPKSDDLPW